MKMYNEKLGANHRKIKEVLRQLGEHGSFEGE